ncbi:MAG: DNA-3-methyladenine glycosylase, partial [Bacteroidota bacterium]
LEVKADATGQLVLRSTNQPQASLPSSLNDYVRELFDLDRDLSEFHALIDQNPILRALQPHRGLRLIRIPDLFETICWTIIGQQINLTFAYKLKARLVEATGRAHAFEGHTYHAFPSPEAVLTLSPDDLRGMQYSRQKADYILTLAQTFADNRISRAQLEGLDDYTAAHRRLVELRGIGPWSADYALLKCLGYPQAFPIADVGLHNALARVLDRPAKPSVAEIRDIAKDWKNWEGYATFFLWRTLIKT